MAQQNRYLAATLMLALAVGCTAAPTCPDVDPNIDFSPVQRACASTSNICGECVCSLVRVFAPALSAGGVTYNAATPEAFPLDQASSIIRACSEQSLVSMLMAGVNVTALAELASCSFDGPEDVPACLAGEIAMIGASTSGNVTAASRAGVPVEEDDLRNVALPTGMAAPLRVTGVQAAPGGTWIATVSGQINSAGQLLRSLSDSSELQAALPAADTARLTALMDAAARIDANPNTSGVLASLENPVDVSRLMAQMEALANGGSVAASGPTGDVSPVMAAGGSTPAASSAAAVGRTGAAALLGAALLAAVMA